MKRLFAASLMFLAIIALCACSAQSSVPTNQPQGSIEADSQETPKTEASQKKVNITIEPPSGWEPVENSVLPVQFMKDMSSFMVKEEKFEGDTLDAVISEAKEAFEGAFDDVSYVGEPETVTVDNKEAKKLAFTCKVSGMQMKYEIVYLFESGMVYTITFGGPEDTFDSLASDYAQILQNISFK